MKSTVSLIAVLILSLFFIVSTLGCAPGGGGTTTGNPVTVDMSFKSYDASLTAKILNLFIKDAHAGISTLELCFKRMRLKYDGGGVGGNLDLELGKISVNPSGTPLGMIEVSDGLYKRVEFDLESDCDDSGSPSVYIVNDNGVFQTNDNMTIKFEGSFRPSEEDLAMAIQAIIDQAKTITSSSEIKDKLESVSGDLPSP